MARARRSAALAVLARGADLLVNDSLHPALLLAPTLGFPYPVAQVYGENLWIVRAARVVTGGRRALVAHPRPAF